jgi:hypothetical protein
VNDVVVGPADKFAVKARLSITAVQIVNFVKPVVLSDLTKQVLIGLFMILLLLF